MRKDSPTGGLDDVRECTEIRRPAGNINRRSERHWLACVRNLGLKKLAEAGFDSAGDLIQHSGARRNRQAAPFTFERPPPGGHGLIHHRSVSFCCLRDYGTVGRIDVGELTRAFHKATVDVVLKELHGWPLT